MKLRFIRDNIKESMKTLKEIHTLQEFYALLRAERSLDPDADVSQLVEFEIYNDFINPNLRFDGINFAIIDRHGHLMAFADSDISTLDATQPPEEENKIKARYTIVSSAEHACCWSARILKDGKPFTECKREDATFICTALNMADQTLKLKDST